jgi:uncharacterized RDD family membrane protein YckC
MLTGFDLLVHSRALQLYWLRRLVAFVVDLAVVLVPVWALLTALGLKDPVILAGLYSGLFLFTYSAILELHWGRTLGKAAVDLRVARLDGPMTPTTAVVRNAARFFWYILPPLDFLLGLATEGDPRQRLTERVLGSVVHLGSEAPGVATFVVSAMDFPAEEVATGLQCRACSGSLTDVGDGTFQCTRCGQMQ